MIDLEFRHFQPPTYILVLNALFKLYTYNNILYTINIHFIN